MKRTWTIIGVRDVPSSFKWYQSLFGQPETQPGHAYFGRIVDADGTVLLRLHQWGAHEHPTLLSPLEFSLRDPDGYFVTISALSHADVSRLLDSDETGTR